MENSPMTTIAIVLVIGLVIGAGIGWNMHPSVPSQQGQQAVPSGMQSSPSPTTQSSSLTKADLYDLKTLIYGNIGMSCVAALAAIVSLMQVSRRVIM